MEIMLKLENYTYGYSNRKEDTLRGINLELQAGEMLLLAGPSGCGKSTLLKAITGILQTEGRGRAQGRIVLAGRDTKDLGPEAIGLVAGTVYQSPDDQLFAMTVRDEVAFALENQGWEPQAIAAAVAEALELVGLAGLEERSIHALSGGQRQRLALAAVLVSKPQLLLLDEPVSQMNPQGAQEFLQLLQRLNREQGMTVLMIEHRVHELAAYFNRLAVMYGGKIVYDGSLEEAWPVVAGRPELGLREPQQVKLCQLLQLPKYTQYTELVVEQLRERMEKNIGQQNKFSSRSEINAASAAPLLEVRDLYYTYQGAKLPTLRGISFAIERGQVVALMGFNGAGKSTLMNLLGGLTQTEQGSISLGGKPLQEQLFALGYLRQEADLMLLADTVEQELTWNNKLIDAKELQELLQHLGLAKYCKDFPLALSKGQRLRTGLAAVLARRPQLLLLDEPTTGQDQQSLLAIKQLVREYVDQGGTVFFCTHDVELAAELAQRVLLLQGGRVLAYAPTKDILSRADYLQQGGLAPSPMLEVAAAVGLPPCLTAEEVANYVAAMGRN